MKEKTILCIVILFLCIYLILEFYDIDNRIEKKKQHEIISVFVFVMSGRYNFEKRKIMRNHLLQNIPRNVIVKFAIGNKDCGIPPKSRINEWGCDGTYNEDDFDSIQYYNKNKRNKSILKEEIELFDDIIELDMVDYYRALPKKLKLAYKWGIKNTNAQWLFKTDDDCLIIPYNIGKDLSHKRYRYPSILGLFKDRASVNKNGKWAERTYNESYYPRFPRGLGYVINRPLAHLIVENIEHLFEYQGEDVSMGIWIKQYFPTVKWKPVNEHIELDKRKCSLNMTWACGHQMKLKDFKRIIN